MEAAIRSLSETLTGFLGVDASGAVTDDGDDEPALVTRLSAVAGAAAEAFAALSSPAHRTWCAQSNYAAHRMSTTCARCAPGWAGRAPPT